MNAVFNKTNPILLERGEQIILNKLASLGGKPYIKRRLWRAANESDLSWVGKGNEFAGRIERACNVNDAGRVVRKINQYLFAVPPQRSGVDPIWANDVTGKGCSLDLFWQLVSNEITTSGWCWVQADRDAPKVDENGQIISRTKAERIKSGDRVFWTLWTAPSVADWYFDEHGSLVWILTKEVTWDNSDPMVSGTPKESRTLWRRGENGTGATWERWVQGGQQQKDPYIIACGSISSPNVPFVLIGHPSVEPWWFDDVELIQAQTMNLDSLYTEILTRTCFPQLVISSSMVDNLVTQLTERTGQLNGERVIEAVREVVRGMDNPFVEASDDRGVTRFLSPSMTDMSALPTEIARKRSILFDNSGLSLFNKESRQIQTAESKAFDHLDTEATLRARSVMLQKSEEHVVAITEELDTDWCAYKPVYPTSFDVTDTVSDTQALNIIQGIGGLTLTQRKVVLRAATKLLSNVVRIDDKTAFEIDKEIDDLKEDDFGMSQPPPPDIFDD